MNVEKTNQDQAKFLSTCAWCNKSIPEDTEVFSLGAKAQAGVDIDNYEGQIIRLTLIASDKTVPAIVPTSASQAKQDGHDFLFMLCSQECSANLKAALQKEQGIVDNIGRG